MDRQWWCTKAGRDADLLEISTKQISGFGGRLRLVSRLRRLRDELSGTTGPIPSSSLSLLSLLLGVLMESQP